MVVVLAIITIISGVVLSSQTSFNKTLVLANTAYDIALTVRSVETFGISSSGLSVNGVGYGLHFDTDSPTSFTLFKDIDPIPQNNTCHPLPPSGAGAPNAKYGDCVYNPDSTKGEWVKDYTVQNGIYISRFCSAKASGSWKCRTVNTSWSGEDEDEDGGRLYSIDIVFTRPNPTPFITLNKRTDKTKLRSKACLEISAPGSSITRSIFILPSGAITVNATPCQAG